MYILILIVGIVLGGFSIALFLQPKLKQTEQINKAIKEENNKQLKIQLELNEQNLKLQNKNNNLITEQTILENRKKEIMTSIDELNKNSETIYEINYQLMQEKLSQAAEKMSQEYQEAEKQCKETYIKLLEENSQEFSEELSKKYQELDKIQNQLNEIRTKTEAAIKAVKQEEERKLEIQKYKINLSDLDIIEINRLREIAPYFRNARAIYKIIWESYYRNNTTDLINRIIGTGKHTGIYKITNLLDNKIYIGQAIDIQARLKEHIKCGLGIDTTNNRLYTAMLKDGVENFSFEVLEECAQTDLNRCEIFWIDYYKSQEYGYNMTKGGSSAR